MNIDNVSSVRCFGGSVNHYEHDSEANQCRMRFAVYLPPAAEKQPVPALYWLSGLTCTEDNFMQKAGAQRAAAELGMAIIAPDTSPRGAQVADDDAYDLGQGAGFYVNATQAPWNRNFQMYEYVVHELPALVEANLPVSQQRSISGHSMGGHGALVIAARNPERYACVSAFAPICNPVNCPWGEKAFSAYLGNQRDAWLEYDACEVLRQGEPTPPILVDQGEDDPFLAQQLQPERLEAAAEAGMQDLTLRRQAGYDHSYYFIASFIEQHLRFHARHFRN